MADTFSSRDVYGVLTDHGFRHVDTEGSHAKLRWEAPDGDEVRVVTVPMGKDPLHPDTLHSIMEQAGGEDFQAFKRWLDDCR